MKRLYTAIMILFMCGTVRGQDEQLYQLFDFTGGMNTWNAETKLGNQFSLFDNLDPNLVNGAAAARLGIKPVSAEYNISAVYYGPQYRVFPVYDTQADSLSQLFYCGIYAAWSFSGHLWGSGYQIGYALPNTPNTPSRIYAHIHSATTVSSDEWVGQNYNSVLRISTGANNTRWLNNRYPIRNSIWYTNKISNNHSILIKKLYLSVSPYKFGQILATETLPWVSDCNLSPLIWTKRGPYVAEKPMLTWAVSQATSGNLDKNTYYAFAPIYDGYQHATMYEDSTGKMYVYSANIDSPSAVSVQVSITVPQARIMLNASVNSIPDSAGMIDQRITGFAIYKTVIPSGDSLKRFDKSGYKLLTSISAYDSSWGSGGNYLYTDSTSYDNLSEFYYDVIGHYSEYDMAVYKYSALLNGRRYCADVYKPTKSGQLFKNSSRVYYNPLQTWTDPPSYALDSFPDDNYISLPENNAVITGMFAYYNRLYVGTRNGLYRITPGADPHEFYVEEIPGSYGINNQRTIQVSPDGVFYKTINNVVYFNGNTSQPIGDPLIIGDSLSYNDTRISATFDSWYDHNAHEYWLFDNDEAFVFSLRYKGWRRYQFDYGTHTSVIDVTPIGSDSLYIISGLTSPERRRVWQYPSDSVYSYIDGDTSNTIWKEFTTGRINLGSDFIDKRFVEYSINASLAIPNTGRVDSTILVTIYIDGTISQYDTLRFTGSKTVTQSIKAQRGKDIKFNIKSSNMKFVIYGLEFTWYPLRRIIGGLQ